jgi:predicted anti-sigma-YlaC factor YlaD
MHCDQIREAISARLDGEEPGIAPAVIDAHVATCGGCRAFVEGTAALHRSLRLAPAPRVPDLTPQVLGAIGDHGRGELGARERGLRIALALLGLIQLGVAVPALLGSDGGVDVHSARHLGSFSIALAVGFLFAAWRPARVAGLLPVAAALVVCVVGTSLLDVIGGRAGAAGEANHVIEVAGLVAAWLLAHPERPGRSRVVAA